MRDAIKMMESKMSQEAVKKAHERAKREIAAMRLVALRDEKSKQQSDVDSAALMATL